MSWKTRLAIPLLAAACARSQPDLPGPDQIARIGGTGIDRNGYERYLEGALAPSPELLSSEALSGLLDQYLEEQLLLRLAREELKLPAEATSLEAIEALLEARGVRDELPEEDLRERFARDPDRYRLPEQVELEQILLVDRRAAEIARRRLASGASLEETVRELGEAVILVDRTVHSVRELPASVAELVFGLKPGEVSRLFAVEHGVHVFRLVERKAERQPSFEETRERLAAEARQEAADRAVARLLEEAQSRYAVEVFDRNLPFAYRGRFPVSRPYEKIR